VYRQANGVCTTRLLAVSRNDEVHWKHGSGRWRQGLPQQLCLLRRQAFTYAITMQLFNSQEIWTVLIFQEEKALLKFNDSNKF